MEDSDSIWKWCRARKKFFRTSKVQSDRVFSVSKFGSLADGSCSNITESNQSMGDSSTTFEGNALQSRVQNSIPEVGLFKNGDSIIETPISEIQDHISSSETNSDTMSDHPLGLEGENQKKRASKSRAGRRGQEASLKILLIKGSSGQYTVCKRETSVETSSSCSISREDMRLHNGEIRNLRVVSGSETSSSHIDLPCPPRASKKPKRDQSLVSEIESQEAISETLFPGLHLLADTVGLLENGVVGFPENNTAEEKGIRKAIFIPTGIPFLQKRVPRREYPEEPYAANSKHLITADNVYKQVPGNEAVEEQMAIPQSRCSRRSRLPSKYRDSVLQPWKIGTRR